MQQNAPSHIKMGVTRVKYHVFRKLSFMVSVTQDSRHPLNYVLSQHFQRAFQNIPARFHNPQSTLSRNFQHASTTSSSTFKNSPEHAQNSAKARWNFAVQKS
jgi:hypothetical protein